MDIMGDMDIIFGLIFALFIQIPWALLVLTPPVAIWRSLSRQTSGRAAWLHPALALLGPFIAAFVVFVLLFLPYYSGQCGGWLGETSPCGFGQYATEQMHWAMMLFILPGLLGMLLGVAVLIIGLIRRRMSRPAA
jgi:hypothetical protein